MSSLAFIGALISSPIFGYISQRYGRKIAGYLTVIPFLIGWLPIIFSELIPLYYVSDSGALGTIRAGVGNLSAILICAIGPILSIRDTAIMCFITPLVFAVAFYWMPESPMFLMKSGRTKEAMEAMTWLRGGNKQNAQEEISKLALVVEESKSKQVSIKSLISSRGTRRGLGMCMLLAAAQQLSGIYPVMNYCVSLFQSAGGSVSPNTASVIMTSLQLFGSIISSILLDYLGRRISMIGSEIIMTLSLGSLGMYFYLQKLDFDLTYVGFLPMLCIALYVLAHSIGIGSRASYFNTTVTAWGLSFMATKLYPTAVFYLGLYGCYWLFSFVCILFTIYIFFKIPETKNRSLDSILRELNDESSKQTDIEVKNKSTKENIPERY
ncbi:hypothetical protein L9F63_026729 [Diploptera punctata]|uniref:Facilitated trehalose transporter Tret1-like n=1 Tax=Diploptera punctata TaxID=6984 RepID=A0AAD8EQB3_DIPPU|nr:hypothetical protein L9F63_026729 [Diploptera punctata]